MGLPKGLNDGFRVFTQEETPLVRGTAVLFDFEAMPAVRSGRLLLAPTFAFERLTVPVYEGETKIGAATLHQGSGKVVAVMSFDYFSPERLDLMVGNPVYAIPRGDYYLDPHNPRWYIVDFIDIEGIDLSVHPSHRPGVGSEVELVEFTKLE